MLPQSGLPLPAPVTAPTAHLPDSQSQVTPPTLSKISNCEAYTAPSGQYVLVCIKNENSFWLDLAPLASPVSVFVAIFGIYAAHALTKRRQQRDERFKLCQTARDLVNEIAEDASGAWCKAGNDDDAKKIAFEVVGKLGRLGRLLEMLRGRNKRFDVGEHLIDFRRAVTTDLDDPDREPNADRAGEIMAAEGKLDHAIDRAFRSLHG
jgi:hypothetical protein